MQESTREELIQELQGLRKQFTEVSRRIGALRNILGIEKYQASITIDTDDDFTLDHDLCFSIYADSMKELVVEVSKKLDSIKCTWGKSYGVTVAGRPDKSWTASYSGYWALMVAHVKDQMQSHTLEDLELCGIHYGGNQSIAINFYKVTNYIPEEHDVIHNA